MSDDAAPITQIGTTVLIQRAALPLLYRATLALIARRSLTGWPPGDLAAPRTGCGIGTARRWSATVPTCAPRIDRGRVQVGVPKQALARRSPFSAESIPGRNRPPRR